MARSAKLDPESLARTLRKQDNVIARDQAMTCGMTSGALRHRMRPGGPWQRLLPGIYLAVTGTPARQQLETAAILYAGRASVITGIAALRRHGLRATGSGITGSSKITNSSKITVLVPAHRPRESCSFVRVWPTTRMPERVCYEGVVQFALPHRAVADAARELGSFRDVRAVVAEAVQRGLCRLDWLSTELAHAPVRHSAWLRRALAEVQDGIRSAAEGDLRDLLKKARLPMPMFNASLYVGQTLIAIADAWWPEAGVAVEVDSREWHLSPEDWQQTLRRNAAMGACGIIVLHFTPRQIRDEPAQVVAAIRSALSSGRIRTRLAIRSVPATN